MKICIKNAKLANQKNDEKKNNYKIELSYWLKKFESRKNKGRNEQNRKPYK